MDSNNTNPCIRCGKQRVVSKTWKGYIKNFTGKSVVIYTENVCPDKECQRIVNKGLKVQKDKRDAIARDKETRANLRKKSNRVQLT